MVDEELQKQELNKEEENIYSKEGREELMEDDEITPEEEGFMQGADGDGQGAKCAFCGEPLKDQEDVVERELKGQILRFCSDEHAGKYAKEHEE